MSVSHETLAQPARAGRKYVSGYRRSQGERTRAAIVEATLSLVRQGSFRPEARAIAAIVGCHRSAVVRHFGSLELLYRVIARQHVTEVIAAVENGGAVSVPYDHAHVAWLIMVGTPRELS